MDQATQRALSYRATREATPGSSEGGPEGKGELTARLEQRRVSGAPLGAPFVVFLLLAFAAVLAIVYLSKLSQGLWEDGYFVIRFARNFWRHGAFSWNVADGPVYGMTSQTLQVLGAALHAVTPKHLVLGLKAACCAALFAALPVSFGAVTRYSPAAPSRGGA